MKICRWIVISGAMLCAPLTLHAQGTIPPERVAAAKELIAAQHVIDLMIAGMRANLPAGKAAMPGVPDEFWSRMQTRMEREAPALADSVAMIYAAKFTVAELEELTAIARTPLGRKVISLQPEIFMESAAMGQRWGMRIGQQIAEELQQP